MIHNLHLNQKPKTIHSSMKAYCLASSSFGNCYILEFEISGMPTYLMIECGIPLSDIYKKMNNYQLSISDICGCLITHAHQDHCCAARHLSNRGVNIFATKETLDKIHCKGIELTNKAIKITDGLYVASFLVDHDIEGAVGFIIKTSKETVIFINDHKRWNANLKPFKPNYVFIECNYDHKFVYATMHDLEIKLKSNDYTDSEKHKFQQSLNQHTRNLNSHCSLFGTLKGLAKMDLSQCKAIFLMHLSDRYANEYRMKNEVERATRIKTFVCGKGGGTK